MDAVGQQHGHFIIFLYAIMSQTGSKTVYHVFEFFISNEITLKDKCGVIGILFRRVFKHVRDANFLVVNMWRNPWNIVFKPWSVLVSYG